MDGGANWPPPLYFSDHLNSPRIITDRKGKEVWYWQSEPFGHTVTAVHESQKHKKHPVHGEGIEGDNDHKDRKFTYNLRFPGQYFDQETGLYYNYYRDYDPVLGRYIESDPIGLGGGINTYAYLITYKSQQLYHGMVVKVDN